MVWPHNLKFLGYMVANRLIKTVCHHNVEWSYHAISLFNLFLKTVAAIIATSCIKFCSKTPSYGLVSTAELWSLSSQSQLHKKRLRQSLCLNRAYFTASYKWNFIWSPGLVLQATLGLVNMHTVNCSATESCCIWSASRFWIFVTTSLLSDIAHVSIPWWLHTLINVLLVYKWSLLIWIFYGEVWMNFNEMQMRFSRNSPPTGWPG